MQVHKEKEGGDVERERESKSCKFRLHFRNLLGSTLLHSLTHLPSHNQTRENERPLKNTVALN